jgi:predicted pyridoxine 5'-phosphate oxidase superfamily flavin-nucleotide-binding protein
MSKMFGDHHRAWQDEFGTRQLADHVEQTGTMSEIGKYERRFIESRDMFFLSTIDERGQPTVSYKGGETGFVKVTSEKTLVFPIYDGNGMFLSVGNVSGNGKIGLLFIDFETPHRLRIHGTAEAVRDDALLQRYAEAQLIVRVEVSEVFANCPRYVHRYQRQDDSKYVPRSGQTTPVPAWKRLDSIQDVLPERDQNAAADAGGTITIYEYLDRHGKGEA